MPLDPSTRAMMVARVEARREAETLAALADSLVAEYTPEQRAYDEDPSRLKALLGGRRCGKSRSRNRGMAREAMRTPGGRFLVINETGGEIRRLNWIGTQGDGIASIVERHGLPAKLDHSTMTATFANGAMIWCIGVDDEAAIRKALGGAYHRVWWDEAQKIPTRFEQTIREVFMPTLLDFGGCFELTGTPSRQMAGLFYEVTRPDVAKRKPGWSVHGWNLLTNPHFGRVEVEPDERLAVIDKLGNVVARYTDRGRADVHALELRHKDGILDLQFLFGGPDKAPLDSPIMQREAFGKWVHEDSNYVYSFHKAKPGSLYYAPHRARPDGFVDIPRALLDLPRWGSVDYVMSLGADLGFNPDPFAFVLWAWTLLDPRIFEVVSWRKTHLTSPQQANILRSVGAVVTPAIWVADASGGGRSTVEGWCEEWVDRYGAGIPFMPADKHGKYLAGGPIDNFNSDIVTLHDGLPRMRLREGGPLAEELSQVQWAKVVSATGKPFEDPTIPNDTSDAGLYGSRHAWHHRYLPDPERPKPGTPDYYAAQEKEMRDANLRPRQDEDDQPRFEIADIGW